MISMYWYRLSRWMKNRIWRRLRFLVQIIHLFPLVSAIAFAVLMAFSGQVHDLYIAAAEEAWSEPEIVRMLCAGIALSLFSAVLFLSNLSLTTPKIDLVYAQTAIPRIDEWLHTLRNFLSFFVAAAPWFGIAIGLLMASNLEAQQGTMLEEALTQSGTLSGSQHAALDQFQQVAAKLSHAAALVLLCGVLSAGSLNLLRHHSVFHHAVLAALVVVLVALISAPYLTSQSGSLLFKPSQDLQFMLVSVYRAIGPIALIALVALALYSILGAILLLPGRLGASIVWITAIIVVSALVLKLPLYPMAVAAIILFGVLIIFGLASRHWPLFGLSVALFAFSVGAYRNLERPGTAEKEPSHSAGHGALAVSKLFEQWLHARSAQIKAYKEKYGKNYPVFIVAAQGGGIYAASAASILLSRLQDLCPSFAQHIFAISGVSGGAIGASVFQGSVSGIPIEEGKCASKPDSVLEADNTRILLDDHLSPLLGYFTSDVIGVFSDRAVGLENSLRYSESLHGKRKALSEPYSAHWKPTDAAPALILNATWAETGYTVAFAPFIFERVRQGTTYAFQNADIWGAKAGSVPLARAALVSARFPAVLPAYTLDIPDELGKTARRLNFVDGGYADNSGAETALEIYETLKSRDADQSDLRLLLISGTSPDPNLRSVAGTLARDTLVPLHTLFSVRSRLQEKSIANAHAALANTGDFATTISDARNGRPHGWKIGTVELDHGSFSLALGWRLSRSTQTLISAMIGDAKSCRLGAVERKPAERTGEDATSPTLKLSASTIISNSCTLKAIVLLVDPMFQSHTAP